MHRRVLSPLLVLAVVACGDAFTSATSDGSAPGDAASLDDRGTVGVDSAAGDDAREDDATLEDATARDAAKEDGGHGKGDASIGNLDAGPALPDGSVCIRACPAGFECIASQCVDRAAPHFSATDNRPFNWSYGYEASLDGAFMLDSSNWTPGSSIDVWTSTMAKTLEPSVFHNSGLAPQTYGEMAIPGEALGFYPDATGGVSIVRWTAPAPGFYAIDVTFTGLSTPPSAVTVGVIVKSLVGPGSLVLNAYGDGNAFTYSAPAQMLAASDAIDFYVTVIVNLDDPPGGVALDARITAE
jgi:hypothetical protein